MKDVLIAVLFFLMIYSWYTALTWGATEDTHLEDETRIKNRTNAYLKAWSNRQPMDSMKIFFAEDHCLNNIFEETEFCELEQIRKQLRWRAQPLGVGKKKLLKIDDLVYSPQQAVISGSILPHRWYEKRQETPMPFLLWVKYDTSMQIVKQKWYLKS
jgi:hypothetical protein